MAEYDEFDSVHVLREVWDHSAIALHAMPKERHKAHEGQDVGHSPEASRLQAPVHAARVLMALPPGAFVVGAWMEVLQPFVDGDFSLAGEPIGDFGRVKLAVEPKAVGDGSPVSALPLLGHVGPMWMRLEGAPTAGQVAFVVAYAKSRPALAAAGFQEYPKSLSGHIVHSKKEEQEWRKGHGSDVPSAPPPTNPDDMRNDPKDDPRGPPLRTPANPEPVQGQQRGPGQSAVDAPSAVPKPGPLATTTTPTPPPKPRPIP